MIEKSLMNVFDCYGYMNDKLVFVQENLTNSSISGTAQNSIIRNGIGNKTWSSIDYQKELSVEIQTNVIDLNQIALACGTEVIKGAVTTRARAKVLKDVNTHTLSPVPADDTKVIIVNTDTDEIVEDATIESGVITFREKGNYKVMPYEYVSVPNAERIEIATDKFPSAMKLVMVTTMVDRNGKVIADVIIEIPRAKPAADFTIASASDISNGNDNTVTFTALDNDGTFGHITVVPTGEVPVVGDMYIGRISSTEAGGTNVQYNAITAEMIKTAANVEKKKVGKLADYVANCQDNDYMIIAIPKDSIRVGKKDNGFGGHVVFDTETSGANGEVELEIDGVMYKLYGEICLSAGTFKLQVD